MTTIKKELNERFVPLPVFPSSAAAPQFFVCLWSPDISVVQTLALTVTPAPPRKTNETCWIVHEQGLLLQHLCTENTCYDSHIGVGKRV